MTAPALDQRWRDWIRSNVARGCSKDQLFRILHDAGFAHADIVDALGHRPTRPLHCIVNPLAGDAAPATRPPAGARRHPSRDVELYVFEEFLDAAQCETLLALVRSRTRPSEITHYGVPDPQFRTSSTCDPPGARRAAAGPALRVRPGVQGPRRLVRAGHRRVRAAHRGPGAAHLDLHGLPQRGGGGR